MKQTAMIFAAAIFGALAASGAAIAQQQTDPQIEIELMTYPEIYSAIHEQGKTTVLVINGDILTTLDFGAMFAFHCRRDAAATIASYPREVKIDFGVLLFEDDPHILTGYQEKPEYSFQVSMGVYILDPVAWDFLTPARPLTMPELLESMRRSGHDIHCYREPCYWLDIGRHDDYSTATEVFESHRSSFLGEPASDMQIRPDAGTPVSQHRPIGPI